jgi:hypothetical protein
LSSGIKRVWETSSKGSYLFLSSDTVELELLSWIAEDMNDERKIIIELQRRS